MRDYKPIPKGAIGLVLQEWGCGDDCACHHMEIRAVFDWTHPHTRWYAKKKRLKWTDKIWESSWWNNDGHLGTSELEEVLEETKEACKHYEIPFDPVDLDYWSWEGERKL